MSYMIIEDKLYKIFYNNEKKYINKSEKVKLVIQDIEKEIIKNRNILKPILLELLNDNEKIFIMAKRISNKLFTNYKSKGIKIRSEEKSTFILSRIILTLCYDLVKFESQESFNEDSHNIFLNEMLKSDFDKMYYYLKDESILGVFFEDYN